VLVQSSGGGGGWVVQRSGGGGGDSNGEDGGEEQHEVGTLENYSTVLYRSRNPSSLDGSSHFDCSNVMPETSMSEAPCNSNNTRVQKSKGYPVSPNNKRAKQNKLLVAFHAECAASMRPCRRLEQDGCHVWNKRGCKHHQ
jgi:hypothetical protein